MTDIIEEKVAEFGNLMRGVKARIEGQRTPNEPGAQKAVDIAIETYRTTLQAIYQAGQEDMKAEVVRTAQEMKRHGCFLIIVDDLLKHLQTPK